MKSLWGMIPEAFSEEQIDDIILESTKYKKQEGFMQLQDNVVDSKMRRSQIAFFDKLKSKHLTDLLYYYAQDINRVHFGFDISSVQDIQYAEYSGEDKGFYDWHEDIVWCNPNSEFHRKISMTIQLSNSDEYEGGDLELAMPYGDESCDFRKKGSLIFFPSFVSHRVTPVTRGLRKALVVWIDGMAFR